ncbi:MAG: calcium-binding protein [Candidatus Hermodarchaeota archaeon]
MDKERVRDLFDEATADCHDGDEQFWGIFYALAEGGLNFPLKARALAVPVEVVDLDGGSSDLRRGITALVRKGDQEYPMNLANLEFVDPDPSSAEWLAVYQYWLGLR